MKSKLKLPKKTLKRIRKIRHQDLMKSLHPSKTQVKKVIAHG